MSGIYEAGDTTPLQQGDILLAPFVRLSEEPTPPQIGSWIETPLQVKSPNGTGFAAPYTLVSWGPVLLLSHDCFLDKEFNQRYRELRNEGKKKGEATAIADADPTLDRWITVARIVAIDSDEGDSPTRNRSSAILGGSVVGWYPLEANVERGIIQGAADLTLPCVIDRMLIASRHASLTASSRNRLRLAIARTGALRTPERGFELEEIVGDRIDGASLVDQDPMTIQLDLRRKGSITLLATPGEPGEGGPTRTSKSAPKKQASEKR